MKKMSKKIKIIIGIFCICLLCLCWIGGCLIGCFFLGDTIMDVHDMISNSVRWTSMGALLFLTVCLVVYLFGIIKKRVSKTDTASERMLGTIEYTPEKSEL